MTNSEFEESNVSKIFLCLTCSKTLSEIDLVVFVGAYSNMNSSLDSLSATTG